MDPVKELGRLPSSDVLRQKEHGGFGGRGDALALKNKQTRLMEFLP